MSKIVPPEFGHRAKDLLRSRPPHFFNNVSDQYLSDVEDVAKDISRYINTDCCLTQSQAEYVEAELADLVYQEEHTLPHEPKTERRLPTNHGKIVTRELLDRFNQIAEMINGFHLDCINCLNEECRYRDPEASVEEVKKRVEE